VAAEAAAALGGLPGAVAPSPVRAARAAAAGPPPLPHPQANALPLGAPQACDSGSDTAGGDTSGSIACQCPYSSCSDSSEAPGAAASASPAAGSELDLSSLGAASPGAAASPSEASLAATDAPPGPPYDGALAVAELTPLASLELPDAAACWGGGGAALLPLRGVCNLEDAAEAAAATEAEAGGAAEAEGAPPAGRGGPWFFCVSPDACSNRARVAAGCGGLAAALGAGLPPALPRLPLEPDHSATITFQENPLHLTLLATPPHPPPAIYYWLGRYDGARFDLEAAVGPRRLDLGRTLYAANLWRDPQVGWRDPQVAGVVGGLGTVGGGGAALLFCCWKRLSL
jgi:hypothetical protein